MIYHMLDIISPEHSAHVMGLKGTVGSLGSMLGPALVVLFTPIVGMQAVFLIAAAQVFMLIMATGLVLRVPQLPQLAQVGS